MCVYAYVHVSVCVIVFLCVYVCVCLSVYDGEALFYDLFFSRHLDWHCPGVRLVMLTIPVTMRPSHYRGRFYFPPSCVSARHFSLTLCKGIHKNQHNSANKYGNQTLAK